MAKKKKDKAKKVRTDLRKNREVRTRQHDLTRDYGEHQFADDESVHGERISGKGGLTRRRTVIGHEVEDDSTGLGVQPEVDMQLCRPGRVLRVHGLSSTVQTEEGELFRCATRGLLKTLATDQRHVVAAGDRVLFRPQGDDEGFIERIEPRHGVLSRTSRGRMHVIVANVDQLFILTSAAEPVLKPNLIDRLIVSAEKSDLRPVICINKIDLIDPADLMPLVGVYGQMGYAVHLISAVTGFGIERVRRELAGRETVLAGQSGVGKSSLLNALEPGLQLKVRSVSGETQKGRHTTTTASVIPLSFGGWVVDTPGVRQFQLWDIVPEEVAGYYRDIRPFVSLCQFPNCTHTHEEGCAVKDAVADGRIDVRRYESYLSLWAGDAA